mmetsp:Transcript_9480/g.23944  ORF Transcript_9480/g.23944 Transcript_9480/m.23944 type:complete len:245 (+) Transcript_9480:144-878(+)
MPLPTTVYRHSPALVHIRRNDSGRPVHLLDRAAICSGTVAQCVSLLAQHREEELERVWAEHKRALLAALPRRRGGFLTLRRPCRRSRAVLERAEQGDWDPAVLRTAHVMCASRNPRGACAGCRQPLREHEGDRVRRGLAQHEAVGEEKLLVRARAIVGAHLFARAHRLARDEAHAVRLDQPCDLLTVAVVHQVDHGKQDAVRLPVGRRQAGGGGCLEGRDAARVAARVVHAACPEQAGGSGRRL